MIKFNIKDEEHRNKLRQEQAFYIADADYRSMGKFLHIPEDYVTDGGFPLGMIWKDLRDAYNKNQLTTDEVRFLTKLRMQLPNCPQIDLEAWMKKADAVEEYYHKNGTLSMPSTTLFPDGSNMPQWIQHQKKMEKKGRLSPYQKDRLEKMGIQWIKQEPEQESAWEEGYRHAEQYFEENGHLFVPRRYVSTDGFELGIWIEKQRKRYFNKSKNKMSDEQVGMLEDICMYWEDLESAECDWSVGMLREFIRNTPKPFVINKDLRYKNYPLGEFVYKMIRQYMDGSLSDEKVEELLSIGFKFRKKIE